MVIIMWFLDICYTLFYYTSIKGSVSHLSMLIMCLHMTINRDIDIINVNWCTSAAVGFSRGCRFTINCSIGWRNTRIFVGFCRSCYTISCCVGWCSIRDLRGDVRLSNNVTSCGAGCWFLKQVTIITWEYDAVLKPNLEWVLCHCGSRFSK